MYIQTQTALSGWIDPVVFQTPNVALGKISPREISPTYCTHGEPGARGGRTPPPIERAAWLRTTGNMERAGEKHGKASVGGVCGGDTPLSGESEESGTKAKYYLRPILSTLVIYMQPPPQLVGGRSGLNALFYVALTTWNKYIHNLTCSKGELIYIFLLVELTRS